MLINHDTDTTDVSGAAFVAVAVLAGLAFTYAGVLLPDDPYRGEVIYAGECLSQAAMLFLVTSLLKHGTIVFPTQLAALSSWTGERSDIGSDLALLLLGLQLVLFLIFFNGLLLAQLGYTILGRVVDARASQRQAADGYFPSPDRSKSGDEG